MAGVIWGNLTNRVRRAPPSPPIPLHSTDWGPEGRLYIDIRTMHCSRWHVELPASIMNPAGKYWCSSGSFGRQSIRFLRLSSGWSSRYLPNYVPSGWMMMCFVEKGDTGTPSLARKVPLDDDDDR
eukprot:scaffold7994_cov83-Skeletonema_dohrnii-CCMP3373.AAC.1